LKKHIEDLQSQIRFLRQLTGYEEGIGQGQNKRLKFEGASEESAFAELILNCLRVHNEGVGLLMPLSQN
jgi:hypothetical protein